MSRLESLASVVPAQCLWGKLQNLSLSNLAKQVFVLFCKADVALPDIFMCLQKCRKWFCAAGAALSRPLSSFCVAGVALCDMPTCFMTCQESFCVARATRNTFAAFSEDALHFSWHAQHFGDLPCHFVWQAQHFRRVVLRIFRESQCQGCVTW